jgi:hypothetical protein
MVSTLRSLVSIGSHVDQVAARAMSAIVQRFIHDALSPEQGWRLIEWCIERGGDEFSFQTMSLGYSPASHEPLTNALTAFHRRTPKRTNMTTLAREESRRPTATWGLTNVSAAVLRQHVVDGFFAAPSYSAAGWFEDFTIYRRSEVMLGAVSHEALVVLCLTEQEHGELSELKIESHETAAS